MGSPSSLAASAVLAQDELKVCTLIPKISVTGMPMLCQADMSYVGSKNNCRQKRRSHKTEAGREAPGAGWGHNRQHIHALRGQKSLTLRLYV